MSADPVPPLATSSSAWSAARSFTTRSARFPLPRGRRHGVPAGAAPGQPGPQERQLRPAAGRASGYRRQSAEQAERLRAPAGAVRVAASPPGWRPRCPATPPPGSPTWSATARSKRRRGRLRLKARNDLLHVDAFPTRPTNGWRILRGFANVNPTEPRVWVTSEPFARLLERYGAAAGLPGDTGIDWVRRVQRRRAATVPARPRRALAVRRLHAPPARLPQGQRGRSRSARPSASGSSRPAAPGWPSPTRAATPCFAAGSRWNTPTSWRRSRWPCRTSRRPPCWPGTAAGPVLARAA